MTGNHVGIFFLAAKTSAGLRLNHSYLFGLHAKQWRECLLHVIRTLHRTTSGDLLTWNGRRDYGLRLNVQVLLGARTIRLLHDQIRVAPFLGGVAILNQIGFEKMVELESLVHSENGGQWLYIDVYVMMRCFDELFVGMGYQRNRFCHVPDLPLRKKRLVGIDQSYGILAGNVGRKNDREFIPRYVSAKADLLNSAVRHGGTYRLAVETIL